MVPASAYAMTSGGEARKFIFTSEWMRPSKFRFPDSTDATVRSFWVTAALTAGMSGPELPMQVVQP
ncbi:hypothetical protein RCH11_003451 [Glaciihabitans sp. GrIS 2.15]|nr:hypothetical protein [Glaciihabitans sp. GrIS 2.15]